jgi:hypothetical protein
MRIGAGDRLWVRGGIGVKGDNSDPVSCNGQEHPDDHETGEETMSDTTETRDDLIAQSAELERLLRLRSGPFGMKLFESVDEMAAIPKIRRPKAVHTTDQIVGQAARLGWTVGITADDLVGAQCKAVIGLGAQDEEWRSGRGMKGVWYATLEDTSAHQAAMSVVPFAGRGRWWRGGGDGCGGRPGGPTSLAGVVRAGAAQLAALTL